MVDQILSGELSPDRAMSVMGIANLVHWQIQQGRTREQLLTGTGIGSDLLGDPNATISRRQEMAFSRRLLELTSDAAIGLLAGRQYRLSTFGHLGMVIPFAATRREAAELFIRYINLSYTHFTPILQLGDKRGRVSLCGGEYLADLRRYYLDRDLAFVVSVAREVLVTNGPTRITAVHLAYPAPADYRQYEEFFGVPVFHGAAESCVEFDCSDFDEPLPLANPLALRLVEPECKLRHARLAAGDSWGQKVRQALAATSTGYPDMAQMAARFNCTDRSLRRYLRQEGVTYLGLLNEIRSARAAHLLRNSKLSVEAVAAQLGYSEAASFSRAFLQWFGCNPLKYRRGDSV